MRNKSVGTSILLMFFFASGLAFAEDGQTSGADFAISKDNVPQKEPDFNPEERAFYYVRVLEIPTPRLYVTYLVHALI